MSFTWMVISPVNAQEGGSEDEEVLVSVVGLGLSERQAKLNAYENFIVKIFNKNSLMELGYDGTITEKAVFLTGAMRRIILDNIQYREPYQEAELYRGEIELNRAGFKQIYQFMYPRILVDLADISPEDREVITLESLQLAMLSNMVYQKDWSIKDKLQLDRVLERVKYYVQTDNTGLAIFPETVFVEGNTLRINNKLANSNEVFLTEGKHKFVLDIKGYFPISGYFYIHKSEIKKITLPLVQRPEAAIPVSIATNLSNELSNYTRVILESYGWDIQKKTHFVLKGNFSHENEELANNFIRRTVKMVFRFGENKFPKGKLQPEINEGTELYYEEYENEFVYSVNDLVTLARQQRLFVVNSLLSFLANFNQQDYRYIYFQYAAEDDSTQ